MSAFWMVGPSATGSEKGMPSSSTSAPASMAVLTISKTGLFVGVADDEKGNQGGPV